MAATFQTLKETMHARLTTSSRPPLTKAISFSQVQGQANAISWKGMTLLNEASTIIGQAVKSLVNTVGQTLAVDDFPEDIDGAYLTSRLLVIGPPRKKLADRDRFRNDASRIRELIVQRHGTYNNCLCFDLAPGQSNLDLDGLKRSVVQFDLDRPTLETLREACAAVVAWLDMDESNVAILTCTNGIKSTCLVAACVWAELNGDTIRQGICKFFEERMKLRKSYQDLLQKLPASYDRLLKTYERERIENENMEIPLEVTRLVMQRVPFRPQSDAPPTPSSKKFMPKLLIRQGPGFRRVERLITPVSPESLQYSEIEGTWIIDFTVAPLILSGDVAFDVHTGGSGDDLVLFSFPVSIGSFAAGRCRFGPDAMDEVKRHILPGDFDLELSLKEVERLVEDASFAKVQPCGKELCSVRHVIRPAKHLLSELMANLDDLEEREVMFALQRTNNDYAKALQLLTKKDHPVMVQQPMSSLDQAFSFQPTSASGLPLRPVKPGVLAPLDGNLSGKKRTPGKKSLLSSGGVSMTTPLKRKLESNAGGEDEEDPTLSPFLRETIGKGLSSPMTPARPGLVKDEDAVGEMDKVLLAQLAQLLSSDASMVQKVEKLAEGKATIVELDNVAVSGGDCVDGLANGVQNFETPKKQLVFRAGEENAGQVRNVGIGGQVSQRELVVEHQQLAQQEVGAGNLPPVVAKENEKTMTNLSEPTMSQHEVYGVFFKMLKMGVPRDAVEQKMKRDGFITKVLDLGPNAPQSKMAELVRESTKTIGDDETFAKYFKMLKMGVPHDAVQIRMDRDGVPREALDLGASAPISKLEELLNQSKMKANAPSTTKKKSMKPKTIRWDAIPEERLQKGIQTIWHHEGVGEEDLQFTNDLENLFIPKADSGDSKRLGQASGAKADDKSSQQALKKKTLLDARRSQSVCIGLAKLKMSGCEFATALNSMDENVLSSRVLQVIQGCNLIPSSEEANTLLKHPSAIPLAEADEFLLAIAKGCPDAQARIEALTFRYVFSEIAKQTKEDADRLAEACNQVKSSGRLKDLLRVVLLVGNHINSRGEDDDKIRAFTLASLLKLSQTKSLNKTTTVLEYLVQFLMNKMPLVLDVADELNIVGVVKRVDLLALMKQTKEMRKGLDAVAQSFKGLEPFCTEAYTLLASLDGSILNAKQSFDGVLDYFGEDRDMTSIDFFTILSSFLVSFGHTRKELIEREKRIARKRQQTLLAQQQAEKKAMQLQQKAAAAELKPPAVNLIEQPKVQTQTHMQATVNIDIDAQQESHPHLAEFLRGL